MQLGSEPRLDAGRQLLRYLHVDPHLVDVGDPKQLRTIAATRSAAGIDQGADVRFARGDDAIEGCGDILEVAMREQAVDFALVGRGFGIRGIQPGLGTIVVGLLALLLLHRDDALGQIAPALIGRLANCFSASLTLTTARAELSLACEAASCASRSGVSISASTSPFFTCAP